MSSNRLQRLRPASMVLFAQNALGVLNGPDGGAYPISSELRAGLADASADLVDADEMAVLAEVAYHAAVHRRLKAHQACGDILAAVARQVYAGDVDRVVTIRLGLSPRSAVRSRVVPHRVAHVFATPRSSGEVEIRIDRSGNAREVIFVVEAQIGSGPWTAVAHGTRTRYLVREFAPGQEARFRATATKNGVSAQPSSPVTIYGGSAATLRQAA